MARNVVVTMTCDLDHDEPEDGIKAIRFAYDGNEYEMDLCEEHVEEYDTWMADYVAHARRIRPERPEGAPRRRRRTAPDGTTPVKRDLKEIRAWAQSNGYKVSDRGRVPDDVIKAFEEASS